MKKYKNPCYWCLSNKRLIIGETHDYAYPSSFCTESYYFVRCTGCHARGPKCLDKEESIKKWNEVMIDPTGQRDVKVNDDY